MPLHPRSQEFLRLLAAQGRPAWSEQPVSASREQFRALKGMMGDPADVPVHQVQDHAIAGVPTRVYRPESNGPLPLVVYFHGGGWVLGDLDSHDVLCRRLALASQCVVVAVDYRLAPEHPSPAALDDAWQVTHHLSQHADDWNIDASRIVVAGDSAGGNLAAGVALRERDTPFSQRLAGQVLIYPVIEPDFDSPSYHAFSEEYGLTSETMQWFWCQFAGCQTGQELAERLPTLHQQYAALGQADVKGVCPAHVLTAEFDVLRDEAESYARRLQAADVPTTTHRAEGVLHGFVHFSGFFPQGQAAIEQLGAVVQQMTRRGG